MGERRLVMAGGDGLERRQIAFAHRPGRGDERRLHQRFSQAGAAAFDRDRHGVDQAQPHAALRFRHEQAGQAHVDQALPDRRIAVFAGVEAAQHFRAVGAGKIFAHPIGEEQLVIGQSEVHQPAPTRGRPSRRSAVILRCTSFEPA